MRRGQNRGGRQKDGKREAGREGDNLAPQGSSPGPGPVFMFGGVILHLTSGRVEG
jgi:hypothetical protein